MTLDNLERQNRGFYGFFLRFWAARHISRANCAKIIMIDTEKLHYKIFSIEHRF